MDATILRAATNTATPVLLEDMLIGNSAPMAALRDLIKRVARSSASVMIYGGSGSGKEVVARAIHAASARSSGPYVALNCGAIPGDLIESELFGHERGAFTGAHSRRIGHFENADNGSLFLDEIGDMPFNMQVKLLRVLEDGLVSRVGGNNALPVDVRIISATHQNMEKAIAEGRFREDLFFRLGVVLLQVPNLASRSEDIPALVAHFQRSKPVGSVCRFNSSAMQRLMNHDWPGNVRELRNIVERGGVLFGEASIGSHDVDRLLGKKLPLPTAFTVVRSASAASASEVFEQPIDLKAQVERMELERIRMALHRAEGVISKAAQMLTLKRTTLIEKMRKYGVERVA